MNHDWKVDRARDLIDWMNDHPMATRREVLSQWRAHGIRTEAAWYAVYPEANRILKDEGLSITWYQHPKPVPEVGSDFWWITGNEAYAREHVRRLVKHWTTRANTLADDAKIAQMLKSLDDTTRQAAGMILDQAHSAVAMKERLDLMPFGMDPKITLSDADLILLRSWVWRTPFPTV